MYKVICLHSSYYRYACVKVDFKKFHKNLKTETQNDAISCGQLLKSHILKLYTVHIFFTLVLYVGKTKNVMSRMKNNVHFRGESCTTGVEIVPSYGVIYIRTTL
jgi:hypothetical protein